MAKKQYTFQRNIDVEGPYDLVVAGGGPAGSVAAISAARLGAKVLLLEATGNLGGMGTSALVSAWSNCSNGKHSIIGGIFQEIVETLYKQGGLPPNITPERWTTSYNNGFGFNSEHYKRLLDTLCIDAGVEIRFFTRVIDVDLDPGGKRIRGVVVHNVEGYRFIEAKTVIDATGDAIVSDLCGVAYWQAGRDTPGIMPPTLCSAVAGIDFSRFDRSMQQELLELAVEEGFFSQPDKHFPGLFRTGNTTAILNAGHLFHTDATSNSSLTRAMISGRQLGKEYIDFCRKYLPGCENMEYVLTASLLGVRESRRIIGEYTVDYDDYKARREFPDQIAIYCKQVDIHAYDLSEEEYQRYYEEFTQLDLLYEGEHYGLPYGMIVPQGWHNLWVAGRCSSSDIKVNGAIRDQPACAIIGQAAGTAAVQHLNTGQSAYELDTRQLVETLRENGGNLPQRNLSPTMSRG